MSVPAHVQCRGCLAAIDRGLLTERVGHLGEADMALVLSGIDLVPRRG